MKGGTHVSRHSSRCVFWCSIETLHLFYDRFSASRTQNDDNRLYWATRAELIPRCDSELRQAVWCRAEVSNFFWCKMCYALRKHNDTLIINLQKTERSTLWSIWLASENNVEGVAHMVYKKALRSFDLFSNVFLNVIVNLSLKIVVLEKLLDNWQAFMLVIENAHVTPFIPLWEPLEQCTKRIIGGWRLTYEWPHEKGPRVYIYGA